MKRFVTGVASVALLWAGQAAAAEAQFTLSNNTGWDITHVYVSTPANGEWSYDLLADVQKLAPGQAARITIPEIAGCRANIRVRYANEQLGYRSGVNVCKGGTITMR